MLWHRWLTGGVMVSLVGAWLWGAAPLHACDTPVYRYAMYRWLPSPYEVYFFHRERAGEADQQVQKALESVSEAERAAANVFYVAVDVSDPKQLDRIPPDVKRRWEERKDKTTPVYMIVSPIGLEVYSGKLAAEEVSALVDSPLRRQVAKELASGKIGVFLLLTCGKADLDQQAEKQLKELAAAVREGKLDLYMGPELPIQPAGGEEGEEAEQQPETPVAEIAYLKLDRNNKREQWLVRQLMAVEPDLHEFVDQPMIFAIYGRGRALPPYIGKGINQDNLADCVYFLSSACSCTVKEQNPGVDLLIRCDWEAAAVAMAQRFGAEEGNYQFGVDALFPELVMGSDAELPAEEAEEGKSTPAGQQGETPQPGSDQAADSQQLAQGQSQPAENAPPAEENATTSPAEAEGQPAAASVAAEGGEADTDRQVALATSKQEGASAPSSTDEAAEAPGRSVILAVSIAVGIAVVVLIGATLLMFRPR